MGISLVEVYEKGREICHSSLEKASKQAIVPFESSMKSLRVTIQKKATELYFPVVLFITLYKVVLTSDSVDEILKGAHFK